jgi:hypothetical protein
MAIFLILSLRTETGRAEGITYRTAAAAAAVLLVGSLVFSLLV